MKTSTEIGALSHIIGEEKAIEYVANAGFDAWDFSLFELCRYNRREKCVIQTNHPLASKDYLSFVRKLKKIGTDRGIVCNQTHAPFPTEAPEIRDVLKKAIECTAEVGAEVCVIHPQVLLTPEENARMYMEYLPYAKSCGVKIATENLWVWDGQNGRAKHAACSTPENFCRHLEIIDDDNFVACLDIGHAEMMGDDVSSVSMIKALGSKLASLHIHDNDKRNDSHQIPFSMDIDFAAIVKALKEINYNGYFTLEAVNYVDKFSKDDAHIAIDNLAKSARKLADMFENL